MNRGQKVILRMAIAAAIFILFLPVWLWDEPRPDALRFVFLDMLTVMIVILFLVDVRLSGNRHRATLGRWAPRVDYKVRDVGRLIGALRFGNKHTRPETKAALTRLLPALKATDAALLEEEHRAYLHMQLHNLCARDADFLIAILQALEQVGDSSSLPAVSCLAHHGHRRMRAADVQAAAQACLATLEARAEQEYVRQTLLRPACNPTLPADTLLRPAQGGPAIEPEILLRPHQTDRAPY